MTESLDLDVVDRFRAAMRNYPATVCVLTAVRGSTDHGMTATGVCSVSMDPPSLLVCVNNRTLLHDMMLEGSQFAVNVLGEDHSELSDAFSGGVPPEDRFDTQRWTRDEAGMLVMRDAPAVFVCRRKAAVPFGSHMVFIGEIVKVLSDVSAEPLVYANAGYCGVEPLVAQELPVASAGR